MNESHQPDDAAAFVPIILAAGRGTRLGSGPKALVEVGGRSALRRCLESCHRARSQAPLGPPVVVLGHGGMHVGAELSTLRLAGEGWEPQFTRNPDPDRGQTSSVKAGLSLVAAAAPGFLVWPVDHPLVQAGDLVALVEAAIRDPAARVVLPSHAGRAGHPALLRASLRAAVEALGPDEPLHHVIRSERPRTTFVDCADPGVLVDIDTPDDLEQALALLAAREARS